MIICSIFEAKCINKSKTNFTCSFLPFSDYKKTRSTYVIHTIYLLSSAALKHCFSNFSVQRNCLGILSKCRFWFSMFGVRPEMLHFYPAPRRCPCHWSVDRTSRSRAPIHVGNVSESNSGVTEQSLNVKSIHVVLSSISASYWLDDFRQVFFFFFFGCLRS